LREGAGAHRPLALPPTHHLGSYAPSARVGLRDQGVDPGLLGGPPAKRALKKIILVKSNTYRPNKGKVLDRRPPEPRVKFPGNFAINL